MSAQFLRTARTRRCAWPQAALLALLMAAPAAALEHRGVLDSGRDVQKQVALLVEPGVLLASNVRLGRIDVLELDPDESLLRQVEAAGALAAVTDRRIVAYGPVIGWRETALLPGEQVESLRAEDYAVFIITDRRHLNFNAASGIWAEQPRPAS